ncbi:MAG: Fur family transcriptional regulator [Acidimicrobiales bacterium]
MPDDLDQDLAQRLRASGLRVTASRLAVLDAVARQPHADADGVADVARRRLGSLSTQAVYNNLHALDRVGLLRRIQPAGGPARYEARVGDNHHHVVCRVCALTCDVDCAIGFAPCLQASDNQGFLVDEAEVTFWGTCERCRGPARPPTKDWPAPAMPGTR